MLGADLLYEERNGEALLELLPSLAPRVLLAEPGRATAAAFFEEAETPGRSPRPANASTSSGERLEEIRQLTGMAEEGRVARLEVVRLDAERLTGETHYLEAGHSPFLSHARELADLLASLA